MMGAFAASTIGLLAGAHSETRNRTPWNTIDFHHRRCQRHWARHGNAGITVGGYFDEMPFDKIMDIVNINLIGVLNGTYAAIPLLKQTENSLCFTTSSAAAIFGTPGVAVYGATKYAVKGFTHAMSVELA